MRALPAVIVALLLFVAPVAAEDVFERTVTAGVPGHRGLTFSDLLRQFIPDLTIADGKAVGQSVGTFRDVFANRVPSAPGPVSIDRIQAAIVHADGGNDLVVLAPLGTGDGVAQSALLALFDNSPSPQLLDAIDVGFDKDTWLVEALPIGPQADALITQSEHANSNQTYDSTAVLFVHGQQFQPIDVVSTFGDRGCGFERAQTLQFSSAADPAAPPEVAHWPIEALVIATEAHTGDDCDDTPAETSFSARKIYTTYKWSDGIGDYIADSDAFAQLAAENEKRF